MNINTLMRNLGLTEEQARQLIEDDKDVNAGKKKEWDLTAEQLQNQRDAINVRSRHRTTEGKRQRKENPDKKELIERLFAVLVEEENARIVNNEREIDFEHGGVSYSVTLTAHRK